MKFSIERMTGCVYGKVPKMSISETLTYDGLIKAVNIENGFPLYGYVTVVDFGLNSFDLKLDEALIDGLQIDEYVFVKANIIDPHIPKSLGTAVIIDGEIFNVITVEPVPIWVGDNNLVYYCEDIEALTNLYGYQNLL